MRISELTEEAHTGSMPESVIQAFQKLGNDQRGVPENAMLQVQHVMGGGVLSGVVEHGGDLTHRMSHMARYHNALPEIMRDKVSKVLRWLTNGYGFEREYKENIVSNAHYRKMSPYVLQNGINVALDAYAKAHQALTVYNKAQWHAREVAIQVGKQQWDRAIISLRALLPMVQDNDAWTQLAFEYTLDSNGNPIPFRV